MPLLPPDPSSSQPENLYAVLGLSQPSRTPSSSSSLSPQQHITTSQIKAAYRRTLLKHHPDKAALLLNPPTSSISARAHSISPHSPPSPQPRTLDIDTITLARDILTNPSSRRRYDQHLLFVQPISQQQQQRQGSSLNTPFTATAETVADTLDLDDMAYDGEGMWSAPCRCGDGGGYFVSEGDLIEALPAGPRTGDDVSESGCSRANGVGELIVGCAGCSLSVRVVFGIDFMESQGDEETGEEWIDSGRPATAAAAEERTLQLGSQSGVS